MAENVSFQNRFDETFRDTLRSMTVLQSSTTIARRTEDMSNLGGFPQLHCNGMFSAATTHNQNVHGSQAFGNDQEMLRDSWQLAIRMQTQNTPPTVAAWQKLE